MFLLITWNSSEYVLQRVGLYVRAHELVPSWASKSLNPRSWQGVLLMRLTCQIITSAMNPLSHTDDRSM